MIVLPELGVLALALFALAIALAAAVIVTALINAMGGVPVIGSVIRGILTPIGHALAWSAGQLETGIDAILGATFHALAKVLEWTFDYYKTSAVALLQLAHLVGSGIYDVSGLRSVVHRLERAWQGIEHGIRTLTREYDHLARRVKALENEVGKGIGNDVLPRIRTLEREVGKVEGKIIPAIEQGEVALQNDITQLGEYIRANFLSSATDAVTAAVAVALTALGLGGLRCSGLLNSLKNRGCGLWNGLEDLLGLFIDLTVFASLCEALDFLIPVVSDVAVPAVQELTAAIDTMPCVSGNEPAALTVPTLHTPPVQSSLLAGV